MKRRSPSRRIMEVRLKLRAPRGAGPRAIAAAVRKSVDRSLTPAGPLRAISVRRVPRVEA